MNTASQIEELDTHIQNINKVINQLNSFTGAKDTAKRIYAPKLEENGAKALNLTPPEVYELILDSELDIRVHREEKTENALTWTIPTLISYEEELHRNLESSEQYEPITTDYKKQTGLEYGD